MSGVSRGAVRPSPPKPYERGGATASIPLSNRQNLSSASIPSTNALATSPRAPARPPLRPWERGNYNSSSYGSSYGGYGSSYGSGGGYGSSYYGSGGYGSSYGAGAGYGVGGYGSYGGPSSYGGYGRGYGGYGSSYGAGGYGGGYDYYGRGDPYSPYGEPGKPFHNAVNRGFSWMDSLYSGVHSFGRFSQVLDANFDAMNGSFRSVLMLVERMGHLNYEVGNFVKGFTLLKVLQSLISRYSDVFKYVFGRKSSRRNLNNNSGPSKVGWDLKEFDTSEITTRPSITSFLVVFAVTFIGLPLLLSKLVKFVSKLGQSETESLDNVWKGDGEEESIARALYDFEPESPQDLGFRAGEVITVTSKPYQDWWEGEIDGRKGMFPSNYVEPLKQKMLEGGPTNEPNNYNSDPHQHQEESQFNQEYYETDNTNNHNDNFSNNHNHNGSSGDWASEERRFRGSRNGSQQQHPI